MNYKEKKYEELMTDPELCQGQIYIKPSQDTDDEF